VSCIGSKEVDLLSVESCTEVTMHCDLVQVLHDLNACPKYAVRHLSVSWSEATPSQTFAAISYALLLNLMLEHILRCFPVHHIAMLFQS